MFAERLKVRGVRVTFKIFPGAGHGIAVADQYAEVYPFLDRVLR